MFLLPLHTCGHVSPPAQQLGAASFNTDLPPRPSLGTAALARSTALAALQSQSPPSPDLPANLHIQCLRSTLLWGFCVRTDTGAAGNGARWNPSSSPPARRGDRQLQAGGSEAPGRTVGTHHVPGSERGYARRRCQKHHGHWHSPDRTGDCGGSGQRHSRYCCAALLGVRPASVFVYNLLTQKAKQ